MKTVKNILAILAIALTMSCETHYRMITTLDCNGKVHREIYAFGDSTFMAGNISANPFLFNISTDWNITRFDTIVRHNFFGKKHDLNVKISKYATSIEQYSQEIQCDDYRQSFAAPKESLSKKFRWFYTNYTFKAIYKKLKYDVPVHIDNYLSKEEQMIWTQGNMNNYKILNGAEMSDYLNNISDKFLDWYSRNCFEISINCIKKMTVKYDLDIDKENIYKEIHRAEIEVFDISPETVCSVLDTYYKTEYFSTLSKNNKEILEKDFEKASAIVSYIGNVISYELVISGKIIKTNAPVINSDTLIWKIDGIRLLFDDYLLTTEYQVVNTWAFIISGLVLIIAAGSLFLRKINFKNIKTHLKQK
jgi:hypothetical protein